MNNKKCFMFEINKKDAEKFLQGFGDDNENAKKIKKIKEESDSILELLELRNKIHNTKNSSERMGLMKNNKVFMSFLEKTGLKEMFEEDFQKQEDREKGKTLEQEFERENLASTQAFKTIKGAFKSVPNSIMKRDNFKEFKINLLKLERNNFNRLIDKEISKIDKGE